MPTILVLNNYSLERVWNEVKRGEKPNHHLFGIDYFSKMGYTTKIVPYQHLGLLQKIQRFYEKTRFPVPIGDLDQQRSAFRLLEGADLIYAPCQTDTQLLCYLRASGLIKIPIVCLAHHPIVRGGRLDAFHIPFYKLFIRGCDAFPSLSKLVAGEINTLAHQADKSRMVQWGTDIGYYKYEPNIGRKIISAGRTGRDFETFGLAASNTKAETVIICPQHSVSAEFSKFGKNVQVISGEKEEHMNYKKLTEYYTDARAIAIPLHKGNSIVGLTSLMDALGMGRPVIMTRNPLIDLDIEALGIGKWIEPYDINGCVEAINWFDNNEAEAAEMGKRARGLVDKGLNSEAFANKIMDIFDRILKR